MLAIVIPYYKIAYFELTLQSLCNQTNKQFKVYIGDDNSNEDPNQILSNYVNKFDFEYKKFDNNLGSSSLIKQWNRCLEMVNDEEWIMILGDDDVLGSDVVSAFYENLLEIKTISNVVRFATIKIDAAGNETSNLVVTKKVESSVEFLFSNKRSSLSEYVFNRNQVFNIGFKDFPLAWYSDVLAVLEFSNFKEVYTINQATVFIRVSSQSISGSQENYKLKSKATFDFYYYLLTQKGNNFTKTQKGIALKRISKCYLNNKKEINLFFKISKIHIKYFEIYNYLLFLKNIIFSFIKINNKKNII